MNSENSIVLRTIILSAIILGGLFIGILFLEDKFLDFFGRHSRNVATGLRLLSLWLVVSASIRTIVSLQRNIPGMKLLLSGVAIAIFASLVFSFFLSVYPQFRPVVKGSNDLLHSTGISLTAFAILGFIVSLIGLINAKVKNKHLGNFLELLVIVSAAAFFIYFATR